jgi:hypothetical protein
MASTSTVPQEQNRSEELVQIEKMELGRKITGLFSGNKHHDP